MFALPQSDFSGWHLRCFPSYPADVIIPLTTVKSFFGCCVKVHKVVFNVIPSHVQYNQRQQSDQGEDHTQNDIGRLQSIVNVYFHYRLGTFQNSIHDWLIDTGLQECVGTEQPRLVCDGCGVQEPGLEVGQFAVAEERVAAEIDSEVRECLEIVDGVLIHACELIWT